MKKDDSLEVSGFFANLSARSFRIRSFSSSPGTHKASVGFLNSAKLFFPRINEFYAPGAFDLHRSAIKIISFNLPAVTPSDSGRISSG